MNKGNYFFVAGYIFCFQVGQMYFLAARLQAK